MMRLFLEMHFEGDVSHIAARSLRNRGYRVLTTQETARNRPVHIQAGYTHKNANV
jgi:hypothetical protein